MDREHGISIQTNAEMLPRYGDPVGGGGVRGRRQEDGQGQLWGNRRDGRTSRKEQGASGLEDTMMANDEKPVPDHMQHGIRPAF